MHGKKKLKGKHEQNAREKKNSGNKTKIKGGK